MNKHNATYFRLGLFIVVGIAIGATLFVAFGAGRWLRSTVAMETYFDESVQGLDVGSPVKYRGVALGSVSRIGFTANKYETGNGAQQYVLVEMELQPSRFGRNGMDTFSQADLNAEIKRGLRVRLAPQGLTGTNYLEIDYVDAKQNRPLPISWQPDALYIPSAHSAVAQIMEAAQNLITKAQNLDIDGTVTRLNRLLDTADRQLGNVPFKPLSESLLRVSRQLEEVPTAQIGRDAQALLTELRRTNQALQTLAADPNWQSAPADVAAAARSARELLADPALRTTLKNLEGVSTRLDTLMASRDTELAQTLDNLHAISGELRVLTENARRNPPGLLFGSEPTPYPLPPR
ncbi:MlaD family protein [Chitiniphilus purpureus]|uniref:MlaD family protein n=1 Tax=Chitiniphilus purpureus TaxID=2981137 RepID=A0ABY6DRW6_9NEIS|nr:MlaD family protein [Chitiniphilus sp. CD1]UXY17109.1 MlaD family protein [Chitiniphilus sp. CD1]